MHSFASKTVKPVHVRDWAVRGKQLELFVQAGSGDVRGDIRPPVRLDITVVVGRGDVLKWVMRRRGRQPRWQTKVNLKNVSAFAGEMDIVMATGWPGILLHETMGHGLAGD